jgi:hypothetical protein
MLPRPKGSLRQLLKLGFCSVNENFGGRRQPLAAGLLLPSASRLGKDSVLVVTHRRTRAR